MKKDIQIPEVTDVFMAIVKEYNPDFKCDDWNVYLINTKTIDIEMVLIVSHGYDEKDKTSIMRKKIERLPANSFAKIEFIQPELFKLNNKFKTTFFADNQLFEKAFVFPKNTIKDSALRVIKELSKKGILSK